MSRSRLSTALTEGLLSLPEGDIKIMRPDVGYDVAELPRERVLIDTGFKPAAEAWETAGFKLGDGAAAATIVVVPRAKGLARAMVAEASKSGLVIVDGQKTDGIDSIYKECRKRLGDLPTVTKAHGRMFWFEGTDAFADWADTGAQQGEHGFWTTAGAFSDGAIDRGSALLAKALPEKLPSRMADFGAGWGYLSAEVLKSPNVQSLDLIEAEALSLNCAEMNVTDARANFHWADATKWTASQPYQGIVMNPPFHTGREGDPGLGKAFIAAAARNLTPSGNLWMVANRHLPYEVTLREKFRHVEEIGGDGAFKLFLASKPIR